VVRRAGPAGPRAEGGRRRQVRRARAALLSSPARSARAARLAGGGRRHDVFLLSLRRRRSPRDAVEAIGEPWNEERRAGARAGTGGVGARRTAAARGLPARDAGTDRAAAACAARRPRLVRARRLGPLAVNGDFDRRSCATSRSSSSPRRRRRRSSDTASSRSLRGLGVPEVVVTFGAGGSLVLTAGHLRRGDGAARLAATPRERATRSRSPI
jgi:hypothetical protein